MASGVVILDNGAHTAKIGYNNVTDPRIIPNCITKVKTERRRVFIGDQIDDCDNTSSLYYMLPFQKGYLINWEIEKKVWDYMFGKDVCNVNYNDTCAIVTEPYFNFMSIQETMTQILFEEYQFHSVLRTNAGTLRAFQYQKSNPEEITCLLVESGYSFTYIVPYVKGKKLTSAIRRIDVGGKVLTNHLKDVISYRQLHVMDETHIINQLKEDICYVSTQFNQDMDIAKKKGKENKIVREYVLPDYTFIKRGYVRPLDTIVDKSKQSEQVSASDESNFVVIRMNNERFSVPEIFFNPSDVGINQCGIPEAIVDSIEATPEEARAQFYRNIYLTGGNVLFPGFSERLYTDLRALAPDLYEIEISVADRRNHTGFSQKLDLKIGHMPALEITADQRSMIGGFISNDCPITGAWQGGVELSKDESFKNLIVERSEYEEHGFIHTCEKFDV
ncbi:Actin-related protein 6 [Nymphon striatum]|nr:Actin-related protein 6 [Nymphon striatum]